MSSNPQNRSRRFALLATLAVAGCGFTPVHQEGGLGDKLRGQIRFTTPQTIEGFQLRERLRDRLGWADVAQYDMQVQLTRSERPATITVDGDTTRFSLTGQATWTLTALASGNIVERGQVESTTSYDATSTTVATQSAADDAIQRLSVNLADMIVARITLAMAAK